MCAVSAVQLEYTSVSLSASTGEFDAVDSSLAIHRKLAPALLIANSYSPSTNGWK